MKLLVANRGEIAVRIFREEGVDLSKVVIGHAGDSNDLEYLRALQRPIDEALFAIGQRDFEALSKKLEPKQNELKSQNDEVESLKKQLNTQSDKLNDDSRGTLVKQIEQKQKSLERQVQDARDDAQRRLSRSAFFASYSSALIAPRSRRSARAARR